jgi:superfamily II DNA/RNA helicase
MVPVSFLLQLVGKSMILSLIFCYLFGRKCHFLHSLLNKMEIDSTVIHSVLPQRIRLQNLSKFRSEYVKVLIGTDVASR